MSIHRCVGIKPTDDVQVGPELSGGKVDTAIEDPHVCWTDEGEWSPNWAWSA